MTGFLKRKFLEHIKLKKKIILVDFSKDKNEFESFLKVYDILKKINISIPQIYEVYIKECIIVMEDFGENKFDKILSKKQLYFLLKLAVDNLIIIQNSITKDDLENLEEYTFIELKKEISEFVDYYIPFKKIMNFPTNNFYDYWENIYNKQTFEFDSFVHKDFEFINLILIDKNVLHLKCGIIDFQNAFIGFKGCDLFSILENPRIDFTREHNDFLIKHFYKNVNVTCDFNMFLDQYYTLNLVRQTKLLGRWVKIFNSGKDEYLKYIEPTKKRIISCLNNIKNDKLKLIYQKFL